MSLDNLTNEEQRRYREIQKELSKIKNKKRGKRNRQRGQEWEREIVKKLKTIFHADIRRGLQSQKSSDADVRGDQLPFWVEAKRKKTANYWRNVFEKAQNDKGKDERPIVLWVKIDGIPPNIKPLKFICMLEDDFLELIK